MWSVKKVNGKYEYSLVQTAYGAIVGEVDTIEEAVAALYIGEADLFEHPYPPGVKQIMRTDLSWVTTEMVYKVKEQL